MTAIYLDNAATTRVDERVLGAMLPYLREEFGNAASLTHRWGAAAERAVQAARRQVAGLIGAQAKEIFFTSGATESNNLAVIGTARKKDRRGNHIMTCRTEHKAVLDPCSHLEGQGFEVTYLPVDAEGMIDVDELIGAIREETILISIMAVNNEIGVVHPVAAIGKVARERGILFHCDASQAAGKMPIDVASMGIDLCSMSGHKIYGPKGIGVLYVRGGEQSPPAPIVFGGGHEGGLRSGTLNVAGAVGMGQACALCEELSAEESRRLGDLAEQLHQLLIGPLDGVTLNGHPRQRVGTILNLSFVGAESEALMMAMPDVGLASGSACTTTSIEPSYVLQAMGVPPDLLHCSLRFSWGRYNTQEDITIAAKRVIALVKKVRVLAGKKRG